MPSMGTWEVHSDIDPRWNNSGRGIGDAFFGPQEMRDWIAECRKKFGDPPKDCTKSFMKD